MTLKIYHYEKCSTCKNALKFLDKKKIKYQPIAIVDNPPSKAELEEMLSAYEGELKKLFNTSGEVYREMKLSDKFPGISKSEAFKLLTANGKLVKRPFLIGDGKAIVGFKENEWAELF